MIDRRGAEHRFVNGEHIIAHSYTGPREGPKHSRVVHDVEQGFAELGVPLDGLLSEYFLSKARTEATEGNHRIVMLDVGSGYGRLATNILDAPRAIRGTRALLREHPEFELSIVGFTDSESIGHHRQQLPLVVNRERLGQADKRINQRISASNFAYTLAAWQTLEGFLKHIHINELDLILATKSLRYLPPVIFQEVLQTGVAHLRVGGRFIAYHYAQEVPGFLWPYNNGFNTNAPLSSETGQFVAVLNAHTPKPLPEYVLQKGVVARDANRYKELVNRGIELYQRLNISDDPDKKLPALTEEEVGIARTKAETIDMLAQLTLVTAFKRYKEYKELVDLMQKRSIIERIPKSIPGVELQWTHQGSVGGFILKKTVGN